jgi:pyruvoyl-dependent arginine decarboxylase (PvlArgDC)
MDLSNKELLEILKKGEIVLCVIADIPCHTQAVKTVGEAVLAVCSKEKCDGLRVKLNSCSKMPFFGSKKDFVLG